MAVMHRALFTWFIFLVFLVLLCLRLEARTHWNWFIIFLPMWVYDSILLIYVMFHLISHCKHGVEHIRSSLHKNILYVCTIVLKMTAQIVICLKLEYPALNITVYHVLIPVWLLLPVIVTDNKVLIQTHLILTIIVFIMILKGWRYTAFIGGIVGTIGLALYPIIVSPMINPDQYKQIQKETRKGIRQEDIQPGNMKVWSDPFERKK